MQKIQLHETLVDPNLGTLYAGTAYYVESQALTYFANKTDGQLSAEPCHIHRRHHSAPSSVLIVRAGGAGDLLFLTPVIREIRRRFPSVYLAVAAFPQFHWVLTANKNVDVVVPMPLHAAYLTKFDWVLDMEDVVETDNTRHVVDIFASRAGVSDLRDKTTEYFPTRAPESFAERCPKRGKRVAVQLHASNMIRTYPHALDLTNLLRREGVEVALYALPGLVVMGEKSVVPDNFISVAEMGWSWGEATDFLQTCDAAVGPDSSMIHFAGALGKPALGLYGSFLADLRIRYQPTIVGYQELGDCAPCFHHGRRGEAFPKTCPSAKANLCGVLGKIDPAKIVAMTLTLLTSA